MKLRIRTIEALFLIIAIINILAVVFYQLVTYRIIFHSDSAIVNVLAGEIVRTGQFFPKEWYYGNGDIWIVFNHAIIVPLLFFFKNGFAVHAASGLVFTAFVLASLLYFGKRLQLSNTALLALLATTFTGVSAYVSESFFGQMSLGYAWGFLFLILTLGVLLPIRSRQDALRDYQHFTALGILLFLLGLTGVRVLFSILLPLFAVLVTMFCVKYVRDGLRRETTTLARHCVFEANNYSLLVFLMGFCLFFYGSGLLLNRIWLIHTVSFMDIASTLAVTSFDQVTRHFELFIEGYLFSAGIGLQQGSEAILPTFYNAPIVSLSGVEMIFRILLFGWLFFLPWVLLLKVGKITNRLLFTLVIFYCFSFFLTLIFYLFSNDLAIEMPAIRYFALLQILSTTISVVFLLYLVDTWGYRVWHLYFVVLVIHSAFSWQHLVGDGLAQNEKGDLILKKSRYETLISLLREKNLRYGYAGYWNASVNTVLSDGDVRIAGVDIRSHGISPFRVLTSEAWYRPSFYRGPTFLVLSDEERELVKDYALVKLGKPTITYDIDEFHVIVYDYNIMDKLYDRDPIVRMREPLPADDRQGRLGRCPESLDIIANEPMNIPLQVWNLSQEIWSSSGAFPVNVGAHLLAPDGKSVRPDILRASLPGMLQKGEQVEVSVVLPPVVAGDYLLSVDLVQEGVAWFNNTCQIRLSVR